jgi:putative DNA primase/helicase
MNAGRENIVEAKRRLPMPELLRKMGMEDRAKRSARCPFHEDKSPSFGIFQKDGDWFWKCHAGCGEGDEIDFLAKSKGLQNGAAVREFLALAGMNGSSGASTFLPCPVAAKPVEEKTAEPLADRGEEWVRCVDALDDAGLVFIAKDRGYAPTFCAWLKSQKLIGLYRDPKDGKPKVAFPVVDEGKVVAIHYRARRAEGETKALWLYHPEKVGVRPLTVGIEKLKQGSPFLAAFESPWDALAFMDRFAFHEKEGLAAVVATRGASNAKLIAPFLVEGVRVVAFGQNDGHGQKWVEDIVKQGRSVHGVTVKSAKVPADHKDLNDWTRAGATSEEVRKAVTEAEVLHEPEVSALSRCVLSGAALAALRVEPRETLLAPFFKVGDFGIVFAKRGTGKTWLSMGMAEAIASGGQFGPYTAPRARRVLYVDGEMALDDTQVRSRAIAGGGTPGVSFLHHEVFFQRSGKTLNLAEGDTQDSITKLVEERGVEVMVLDNLSCLMHGMAENDADDWGKVLPWLLHLRRIKVAVVLVAHAGRNGQIRGTSKREDQASWALGLNRLDGEEGDGTMKFTTAFSKNRNCLDDAAPPLAWTLRVADGAASVTTSELSGTDALVQWVEAGLEACHEIAEEMGLSKGTVSKMARKAAAQGRIRVEGRRYLPAEKGGVP